MTATPTTTYTTGARPVVGFARERVLPSPAILATDRVAETSDPRVSDGLFGNSADSRERRYLEKPGMGPYAETPNPFGNGVSVSACAVTGYEHGAYRDRTDDLLVANQALSQLS